MSTGPATKVAPHVQHVRVRSQGPLREAVLKDLGRINVICGRNNSGKSTLLRAINSDHPEIRAIGKVLTAAHLSKFFDDARSSNAFGWRGHDVERGMQAIFERHTAGVVKAQPLWFSSDDDAFTNAVMRCHDKPPLNQFILSKGALARAFRGLFNERLRTLMVPPKRNLETSKAINFGNPVHGNGAGIADSLLHAKTQLPTSQLRLRYESLVAGFQTVTSGYTFDVATSVSNDLSVHFSKDGLTWLRADDCGLGLQDVLIILYCALLTDHDALLIEEPENHLHPDMQRRLLAFLRQVPDCQVFLSTHSNVFLDNTLIDRVFFTEFDGEIRVSDATGRASILADLGYSVTDNLVSDLVILVEGITDVPVVEEFLRKMGLYESYSIRTWPLNGDQMAQLDLAVLAEPYNLIALVDRDPKSRKVREQFEKNCADAKIPVHRLNRNSIENYFTVAALRAALGNEIPAALTRLAPQTPVLDQVGFNIKKSNRRIAQAMTLDDVRGTDFAEFLDEVRRMLTTNSRGLEPG